MKIRSIHNKLIFIYTLYIKYIRYLYTLSIMTYLLIYNTKTRAIEEVKPIRVNKIGFYACGPTVYQYAHIGNFRTYIFEDILKRTLRLLNYKVKHVINITDVGHLTSDENDGEDKIEKEARRQRKTAYEIARFYEKVFKKDIRRLNIEEPDIWARASEHIKEQINLIKILEKKGFTYRISDGIYFDVLRFRKYGELWKTAPKETRARDNITIKEKKNPQDFALWKFSAPSGADPSTIKNFPLRDMQWPSPWGIGFPGWHIECSAMSMKYLGKHFDVHAGGIDHIPVHHTNEIAQSEAASNMPFVNYWVHGNFLLVGGKRMGKSEKNFLTLDELVDKGFDPLDYRYLALTAHYRSPLFFSLDALKSSRNARLHLTTIIQKLYQTKKKISKKESLKFKDDLLEIVRVDLDTPKGLALLWSRIEDISINEILWADRIFGLGLNKVKPLKISNKIRNLLKKRDSYRKGKNWKEADIIRLEIKKYGFEIEDSSRGPVLTSLSFS